MKKIFFHKEAILKRGQLAKNFIVVIRGKALVLDSMGNKIVDEVFQQQSFGLVDTLKENKWKNTVVSENNSEILFVSRDILVKNLFDSRTLAGVTLNLLKMAS